jgi:transcriptional regulator with XRE-family HTH domain
MSEEGATGVTCQACGGATIVRNATAEKPYAYAIGGLPGVALIGIRLRLCERCGSESPLIPRIEELHRVIARDLLRKQSLLTGDELRFLRKHAGFPAAPFAALLRVTPAHLSRFENAHEGNNLGAPADRLARALVATASAGEDAREVLFARSDAPRRRPEPFKPACAAFRLVRNRWRHAA